VRPIVGITGATEAVFGVRLLERLSAMPEVETHLVLSRRARTTIEPETGLSVQEVTPLADAQHHGGPWPATNSVFTSVDATAVHRFLRPVTWQSAPASSYRMNSGTHRLIPCPDADLLEHLRKPGEQLSARRSPSAMRPRPRWPVTSTST
jgi:3-polyprenyl-4-hydroxybenzoate decarboxylase